MKQLANFLRSLRGDVYKLLPMKQAELLGKDCHLGECMEALIINITGAIITYPVLAQEKQFLYVLNNMNFLRNNEVDFWQWRKIVLNSTRSIDNLYCYYEGVTDDE